MGVNYRSQFGNYGNLPPLQKIFVKSIHSITLSRKKYFDGIFAKNRGGKICNFPNCGKMNNLISPEKYFVKTTFQQFLLVETVFLRIYCQKNVRVSRFLYYPHPWVPSECGKSRFLRKNPSNQRFSLKQLISRIFQCLVLQYFSTLCCQINYLGIQ